MSYSEIEYSVADGIAVVMLNRPDRFNGYTPQMHNEMVDALDQIDEDDDVRAVIFTGAGRAYCVGADLGRGESTFDAEATAGHVMTSTPRDQGGLLTLRLFECTKPIIAAVNGHAVGIGITMTLPMDIRLLADDAKVGFVFGSRGIVVDAASSWFLPRVVGIGQAQEWVLTARVFDAAEALRGRLVRSIHPADEVLEVARTLAREIVRNTAPVSATLTRQLLWRGLEVAHPMDAHRAESKALLEVGRLPDSREGVRAFLEKRPAVWSGRPKVDLESWYPWWTPREFDS